MIATKEAFGEQDNLSIVSYDFCTLKYYLKTALSRFSSSSHPTTRMRHRKRMSGFKKYSVRDCKLPQTITSDQECSTFSKLATEATFILFQLKQRLPTIALKFAIVSGAVPSATLTPPPPIPLPLLEVTRRRSTGSRQSRVPATGETALIRPPTKLSS